jgi:hypothetical protein
VATWRETISVGPAPVFRQPAPYLPTKNAGKLKGSIVSGEKAPPVILHSAFATLKQQSHPHDGSPLSFAAARGSLAPRDVCINRHAAALRLSGRLAPLDKEE